MKLFSVALVSIILTFVGLIFRPATPAVRTRLNDTAQRDTLLENYPLSTVLHQLKSGHKVKKPFHALDALCSVISGGADFAYISKLVEKGAPGAGLVPVKTTDGRGIASIWLVKYGDSTLGPYQEVVVTILVAPAGKASVPCSSVEAHCAPYAAYLHGGVMSFAYKLWLDEEAPIAYGREILGTDKFLSKSLKIDMNEDGSVEASLPSLLKVKLQRQSAAATLPLVPSLALTAGLLPTLKLLVATPMLHLTLVTPAGVAEGFRDSAPLVPTIMVNDPEATINPWDKEKDALGLDGELKVFGFVPATVQQTKRLRFAMLAPFN